MRQLEFYGLPVIGVNMLATKSVMENMDSQGQTNTEPGYANHIQSDGDADFKCIAR